MINKIITTVVASAILFSGCAVKQEDSITTKAFKNTVNVPAVAVYGAGKVTADVLTFAVFSPFALMKSFSKNSVDKKIQTIKNYQENKKLKSKKIFIKDYTNEFNTIAMQELSKQLKEKSYSLNFLYQKAEANKVESFSEIINDKKRYVLEYQFPDDKYMIQLANDLTKEIENKITSKSNDSNFQFKIDSMVKNDNSGIPILDINKNYSNVTDAYIDYLYINRALIEYAKNDKKLYNISLYPDFDKLLKEHKLELRFLSTLIPNNILTVKKYLKDFGAEIVDNESDAEIIYHTQFVGIVDFYSLKYSETLLDKYFSDIVLEDILNDHKYNYIALDNAIDFEEELEKLKDKKHNKLDYIKYRKKNKPFKSNIFTLSQGYLNFKDGEKFDKPVFGGDYAFAANLYFNSQKFRNQSILLFTSELLEADSKR